MPSRLQFKVDKTEFTRALQAYREYSKRDVATICNTKAFYIARRATLETPKATKAEIKEQLLAPGELGPPLAALIVNKARRMAGLPGLEGPAMKKAVNALIKSRRVATLRAGWLPAIRILEPLSDVRGRPPMDRAARQFGKDKGRATPAVDSGWTSKAVIENLSGAKWDVRDTATPKATPALQRAFDAETQSTREYIERKQREAADRATIRHN